MSTERAVAMHHLCVGCLAREQPDETAEEATMTLLAMLLGGHTVEDFTSELCFAHRRHIDDAAARVRAVLGDSA